MAQVGLNVVVYIVDVMGKGPTLAFDHVVKPHKYVLPPGCECSCMQCLCIDLQHIVRVRHVSTRRQCKGQSTVKVASAELLDAQAAWRTVTMMVQV